MSVGKGTRSLISWVESFIGRAIPGIQDILLALNTRLQLQENCITLTDSTAAAGTAQRVLFHSSVFEYLVLCLTFCFRATSSNAQVYYWLFNQRKLLVVFRGTGSVLGTKPGSFVCMGSILPIVLVLQLNSPCFFLFFKK